jgi:hypothetical protein
MKSSDSVLESALLDQVEVPVGEALSEVPVEEGLELVRRYDNDEDEDDCSC